MKINLPSAFVDRVRLAYADWGLRWLESLPKLVKRAAAKWGLSQMDPSCSTGWSFVAFANQGEQEVVLKLVISDGEIKGETRALRFFDGQGAVRLTDEDRELRASLMERASPGTPLRAIEGESQRMEIAIQVLKGLQSCSGRLDGFPTFHENEREYFRFGRGVVPEDLLDLAITEFDKLHAETSEACLVHGDFHPENIVLSDQRGWLVIDPDGLVADAAFDAASLVRDRLWEEVDPIAIARDRVSMLSQSLGLEPSRLLRWAFAQCILSACWAIEDRDPSVPSYVEASRILRGLLA